MGTPNLWIVAEKKRKMDTPKLLVAMPAYNEAKVISRVIEGILSEGFDDILVVDDSSADSTYETALLAGAKVIRHPINRGPGAATATIIEYSRRNQYDFVIILDSDGQHDPKDIRKLLSVNETVDVVIGSRYINRSNMPLSRRLANFIGSIVTFIFFGLYIRDSQSGFKRLSRKAVMAMSIRFDGFEFCSEMVGEIKRKRLSWKEVPISVIYTRHSRSKGQSIMNGIRMVIRFIMRGG
jgi:polyprenyl-phospho-N-acetylgalactosaminyl synthase